MKFLFALAAALLSLGLTQPTLSGPLDTVLILQCTVAGTAFEPTAASEGRNVRRVVFTNSCARELERYLRDGFNLRSILGDQSGSVVTYTFIRSP